MNPSPDGAATSDDVSSRMGIELRTIGIPPRPAILDRIDAESPSSSDFNDLADLVGSA